MTPEEIISDLKHNIGHCNDLYDPYKLAVETIYQYAREMCNKQKEDIMDNMSNGFSPPTHTLPKRTIIKYIIN
jgi:arabinogalactan endo-1,4-beta-galactosidase